MRKRRIVRLFAVIAFTILVICGLSACSKSKAEENNYDINTVEGLKKYLSGKTVAFMSGTLYDKLGPEWFPESNFIQFNSESDVIAAVANGKAEACLQDKPVAEETVRTNSTLRVSDAILMPDTYGFIFNLDNTRLRDEFNEALKKFREEGLLEQITDKWCNATDRTLPDIKLTGENGVLNIATTASSVPFTYREGDDIVGLEFEILARFCEMYGYKYEVLVMDFTGLIPAVVSGKCDIAMNTISITDERKKSVCFTDPYYEGGTVATLREESFGTNDEDSITSMEQLQAYMKDKRIAAIAGSVQEGIAKDYFPDSDIVYYSSVPDALNSIEMNKTDTYFIDIASFESFIDNNPASSLKRVDAFPIDLLECGFIVGKDKAALREQIDEYFKKLKKEGSMQLVYDKWMNTANFDTVSDKYRLTGENGVLRLATPATNQPFEFVMDGEITGEEIELMYMFCEEYGYGLEIADMEFPSVLAAVQTGKADVGCGTIVNTPERSEQVLFTESTDSAELFAIINSSNTPNEEKSGGIVSFFKSIGESFRRTFITENRWKLILEGLLITLLISILSCAFGTILGFGVCMANRSSRKWISVPARVLIRIIQGTPIVVMLMILYFVIFGDVNPIIVAIVGFSINFGVYVSEMMRTGIEAVDKGQNEAASAIGFTKLQAFTQIVMPQAAKHFLPVFKGEFISMVKMTSVVGYISIQDLTKMSDIIRSRTYDAFFPLIATAVIYFLLSWLLTLAISYIEVKIDPKHRTRVIKGVKEHD